MSAHTAPSVVDLRFEHHRAAARLLAVETATPRLSWRISGAPDGWRQEGYEVEVTRAGGEGHETEVATVKSAEQILVPWPTTPLASRQSATVRIRVRGRTDHVDRAAFPSGAEAAQPGAGAPPASAEDSAWSPWSARVEVEAALLDAAEWEAAFIAPVDIGGVGERAPVVSRTIEVPDGLLTARLRATAHGVCEPSINGVRVDDSVLNPGWTSYTHRLQVVTWDVTELLQPGTNRIDVLLGNGWWRGHLGYLGDAAVYGDRLALAAQLELTAADGTRTVIVTDESWTAAESAVVADDLYDGQTTDLRLADSGASAHRVEIVSAAPSGAARGATSPKLVPQAAPRIRPTGALPARRVWNSPSGKTLVDFGQNAVGVTRLTVRGLEAGTEITIRHAEVLEDGELGTRPLRGARATDTWILPDAGEHVLRPTLTLHGLRYAEVSGVPDLAAQDIELIIIGSDLEPAGTFACSHPLLNRLHDNVVWSTRGNFVSIPTDCPQRDERLGWTGDIQAFAPTAAYLFDTTSFLQSWLTDLAAEQYADGGVRHFTPTFEPAVRQAPAAAWGDAATLVPWAVYEATGDPEVLRAQLPSMRAWVDRVAALAGEDRIWSGGFQFGDWLDPTAPPDRPADAKADPDVVATAYFARSARVVADTADRLNEAVVAAHYRRLADEARAAFNRAFVTPAGRIHSDAQTVYALAICWGLLPTAQQRAFAGERLADLVRLSGFHIATGFVGTPLVIPALVATGHADVAGRLLLQTECPSWLYPVTMGATTIWERWDSMLPNGDINPGEMTSFNHYALGAVADWLHRGLAGLSPAVPGWGHVEIAPAPIDGVTSAATSHLSPYGRIAVSWEVHNGVLELTADLPVGVTGTVRLPDHSPDTAAVDIGPGHHAFAAPLPARERPRPRTVRELMDDPAAWEALIAVMADAGDLTVDSAGLARRMRPLLDRPPSTIAPELTPDPRFAPPGLRERIETVIGAAIKELR
ncbi:MULTISPECIES: alpha-L-rhamnosidase [unclassified Actinomyces]|uniref:alpha-L-rhamnosidase n=1 Tax=unclassified Actinomyces TaxID=2609248 RepID=UPI000D5A1A03|nr:MULTISPECIES: alpha-L-rhamnosidase [unclassified Actinomyces]RAX20683.1 alpha-L-rhamnosidase [Actinomyces sp. Z5]RAX21408.1 alpha-L-rhamnosidase [Actinomyces sp. Z3]